MASHLLYNNRTLLPRPDLWRSSFAILIGTNPLVAKGSLVSEPRFKEALDSIIERGGRVIVIDPRRTETARRYEHLPVRSEEHTSELQSLMRISYAVFCLKKKKISISKHS